MDGFGDVSGHFRGLLNRECEVVVVGVVMGPRIDAQRCPKKAVRNVQDIKEARWNDLTITQKRRLLDCFSDNENLQFGYSKFTRDKLVRLHSHHLLFQNVEFPPAWDLALTGWAYGEILFEHDAMEERRVIFTFDRVASKPDSNKVVDHVETFVSVNDFAADSQSSPGVQAADCFAGAVAEDHKRDTDWLSYIDDDRVTDCTSQSLVQLEHALTEADK